MKVKFSQFIFAFLICFSFCNFAFAQGKSAAVKIDDYSERDSADLKLLAQKKTICTKIKKIKIN